MTKRWCVAEPCPSEAHAWTDSALLSQLLWNRGLRTPEEMCAFLSPAWESGLHDANQFRHLRPALDCLFDALESGERITVHGDYDADGITGSTILITVLREIQKQRGGDPHLIDSYIPHRDKEGYGLHAATVPKLKERGTSVIVTVDCGIACVEEIRIAKEQGMDTVVVDHHQFGEVLPDGHLIHPGLPEETYPFKHLAAVGVSYKFATALLEEARARGYGIPTGWEKWLLDLVAIATVTDMVPLVGENRVLETYGLRVLNKTRRPGLLALAEQANLRLGEITSEDIGFGIGPRLNAAGRMDHASLALRLLLAESSDEARLLAGELEELNRARQTATKKMMAEADAMIASGDVDPRGKAIVLWNRDWSPALVGLAAGRFSERFHRPTLVLGFHEPQWIGSGRSVPGFDIVQAVKTAGEGILTRSGGHAQACGFALEDPARLHEFRKRMIETAERTLTDEMLSPELSIDAELPLEQLSLALTAILDALEPHGMGNPKPVFLARGVRVAQANVMGSQNNHLRMDVIDRTGRKLKAVGFKQGERIVELRPGQAIDLVYTVAVNDWNGRRTAECRIIDFRSVQ